LQLGSVMPALLEEKRKAVFPLAVLEQTAM
jgi:hypothetical protein